MSDDPRLARISDICLALPEVTREDNGPHSSFAVRKKKFAYFLDDHHGDGKLALCWRATPGQETLLESEPDRFFSPAYLGSRGWLAVRLDLGEIDWEEISDFVDQSYRLTAPRGLLATLPPLDS